MWKKLNLTQKARIHESKKRRLLQHKIITKKVKPGLVVFYDIRPGNGAGLFSKEKKVREKISKEKSSRRVDAN